MADLIFRFQVKGEPLVFRFQVEDYPPLKFRFQAKGAPLKFRFQIADAAPLKFRFRTVGAPLKFRFRTMVGSNNPDFSYAVSDDCKSVIVTLAAELQEDEELSFSAFPWNSHNPISSTANEDGSWTFPVSEDGSFRAEILSSQRGRLAVEYVYVSCRATKRFNRYVMANCGCSDCPDEKFEQLKALLRTGVSLHKNGFFTAAKGVLDQIMKRTENDKLF